MKYFENNIVLFGFGAVGKSVLSIMEKEISFDVDKLLIIDKQPQPFPTKYKYLQAELLPSKQENLFAKYLKKGDLLIDLTSETDCLETIKWCHENAVMYLNTGDNEWPDKEWKNICDHCIDNHNFLKNTQKDDATIIIHHGANPGSVSHFVKKALFDIVQEVSSDTKSDLNKDKLQSLLEEKKWGELAEYLQVMTVQSSDYDTQIIDEKTIRAGVFYSTWNPQTFFNESICQAEIRLGTTEKFVASDLVDKYLPKNGVLEFKPRGTQYYAKSWSPAGEFEGMIIGHEEVFSIADCLSTYHDDGSPKYRPTVYFSYLASDIAMRSLANAAAKDYQEPEEYKLITEGILAGTEYVGVLLMGNKFKSRWVGNYLSLEKIAKDYSSHTPTILQVAIPAVAAISYMIKHRNIGFNYPDNLPYEPILATIEKYAGKTISQSTDFGVSHKVNQDFKLRETN